MEKFCVELSYTVPEDDARAILREYDKASMAPAPGLWATNAGITVAVQLEAYSHHPWRYLLGDADRIADDLVASLAGIDLPEPWRALVISLDGLEADVREARRRDPSPLFVKPDLGDDEVWELFHELGSN
jgi:hypothetical protein